jgi:hypothetical protein
VAPASVASNILQLVDVSGECGQYTHIVHIPVQNGSMGNDPPYNVLVTVICGNCTDQLTHIICTILIQVSEWWIGAIQTILICGIEYAQ